MRIKICFLGDVRSTHVQKFVKWFADKGHETHLISLMHRGDDRTCSGLNFFTKIGTPVRLIDKRLLLLSPLIAKQTISSIKPDIVQCHFITNYGALGAYSGVHPLVIMAMGDDILIHPSEPGKKSLVRYALKRADHMLCDGENSIRELLRLGIPGDKIDLVYPGVDMDLFNPVRRNKTAMKFIFYPRGFDEIYNVDMLFNVIMHVAAECPDTIFLLLGKGTERERFQKMVNEYDLTKNVVFLGNIDNKKIPGYLASCEASITCSLSDGGIPTSTIEALACGVPVVSTDAGDARIWIKDGVNGFVVDKKDSEAMAERILRILKYPKTRERLGINARESVERVQNYAEEMQKVEEIYSRLLGRDL